MSPSATGASFLSAASFPAWMRWHVQRLHFSITPRRTDDVGIEHHLAERVFML
jgi:hypothetical protein